MLAANASTSGVFRKRLGRSLLAATLLVSIIGFAPGEADAQRRGTRSSSTNPTTCKDGRGTPRLGIQLRVRSTGKRDSGGRLIYAPDQVRIKVNNLNGVRAGKDGRIGTVTVRLTAFSQTRELNKRGGTVFASPPDTAIGRNITVPIYINRATTVKKLPALPKLTFGSQGSIGTINLKPSDLPFVDLAPNTRSVDLVAGVGLVLTNGSIKMTGGRANRHLRQCETNIGTSQPIARKYIFGK